MMRALPADDVSSSHLAYLHDRVAINHGRSQAYGTQGRCVPGRGWEPLPLEDESAVDELRAEAGLRPLADYRALFDGQCSQ